MIVSVKAGSVKKACAVARKALLIPLEMSREILRSGGEDGIYRIHLADGTIIEASIEAHHKSEVLEIRQSD